MQSSVTAKRDTSGTARDTDDLPRTEWRAWAACSDAIGAEPFAAALLNAIYQSTGAEHLAFFSFQDIVAPVLIAAVSKTEDAIAEASAKIYLESAYYHSDPQARRSADAPPADGEPLIFFVANEDVADPEYCASIYERYDLDGRLSLLDHRDRNWHAISIFKHRSTGGFEPRDISRFVERAPLISSLAATHLQRVAGETWIQSTRPPLAVLEDLVQRVGPTLSNRETDVCSRALQGLTGEGIALDLSVSEHTVATLRKRAYAKLEITTLNELFALCLGAVAAR